ncbi:E3 ubiquitin-protein ligase TRIM71-like [Saccoglossus kowalevskii]
MAANMSVDKVAEDLLTCSICLERYRNPKILPCHHSFCLPCLVKLKGPRDAIKCPNCRQEHFVNNVRHDFPPSMIINSVMDIFKQPEQPQGDGTCHGCQENPSTNTCVDCAMDFCTTCTKAHRTAPVSRQHRIMTVDDFKTSNLRDKSIVLPADPCTSHQDKLIELYCEDCQTSICLSCLGSNHKGHQVIDLKGAAEEFCKMATENLKVVKTKLSEEKRRIKIVTKKLEELSKQQLQQKRLIQKHSQETIRKLTKVIKQEESSLLDQLNTDYKKLDSVKKVRMLESNMEQLTLLITYMEKMLRDRIATQLMSYKEEAVRRIEYVISLDLGWECDNNSLLSFHPNDIKLQGTLGTFHNTEVESESRSDQHSHDASLRGACAPMKLERTVDAESGSMKLQQTIGGKGTKQGKFSLPLGLCVNAHGDIAVADHDNARVQVIDARNGRSKLQFKLAGFSKPARPIDISSSVDGRYFITDGSFENNVGNNQVIVCNEYGKVLKCFGKKQLQNPWGIAVNHRTGCVLVVDREAHCIRTYLMTNYRYISSICTRDDMISCRLEYPMYLAIDSRGCLIVSVDDLQIQIITPDGKFEFRSCPIEGVDSAKGVAMDADDNIYVCDVCESRVQMYDKHEKVNPIYGSEYQVSCLQTIL